MRSITVILSLCLCWAAPAAELESRVLTHYVPQDFLETVVRTEKWTELSLDLKGGLRKGDVVRIWAGGGIDFGNGDQPGQNVSSPDGRRAPPSPPAAPQFALSLDPRHAFAVLFKTEQPGLKKCLPSGRPLEILVAKDNEKIWIGFNDLRGHYFDNHLGKGRRHELDPLWMRVEVVRTIVD